MKTLLLLGLLTPILLNSCASFGAATGFTREVPPSVAQQGKWATFKYRVFEVPDTWDPVYDPFSVPGEEQAFTIAELVNRRHRQNLRSITANPGYESWDAMHEDWVSDAAPLPVLTP